MAVDRPTVKRKKAGKFTRLIWPPFTWLAIHQCSPADVQASQTIDSACFASEHVGDHVVNVARGTNMQGGREGGGGELCSCALFLCLACATCVKHSKGEVRQRICTRAHVCECTHVGLCRCLALSAASGGCASYGHTIVGHARATGSGSVRYTLHFVACDMNPGVVEHT
jgi:hypothetical protein